MPRRTPNPKQRTPRPPTPPRAAAHAATGNDVDPRWILKALAFMLLVALFCGYVTMCLLFYQGQWQLVLHPQRNVSSSSQPPVAAATAELIHFAPDESAIPQLTGWWIPAPQGSRYANLTALYLRGADGSLADSAPALTALHALGLNVFAFDYRGYGRSAATHPSQRNMTQDADSAWQYLTTSRAIPAQHIIPYGIGVGTSLAARLAIVHPAIAAVILESPQADLLEVALRDRRTQLLPARHLFHEVFPLAAPLATLHTPKLLLTTSNAAPAFQSAADPRLTVEFTTVPPALYTQPQYTQALLRFLDQYLPPTSSPQSPGQSGQSNPLTFRNP